MKKTRLVISIILCLVLCMNLMPVYGQDTSEPAETENVAEIIEENENIDTGTDITDVPEVMPMTPPAGVKTVLTSKGNVKVSWNKVYNAAGYEIYRSTERDGEYVLQQIVEGKGNGGKLMIIKIQKLRQMP